MSEKLKKICCLMIILLTDKLAPLARGAEVQVRTGASRTARTMSARTRCSGL